MKFIGLLVSVFLFPSVLIAGGLTASEIAQKAYDRDDGRTSAAQMQMVLIDSSGNERIRNFESRIKDFGNLSRRYIRFTSPAAIDGTTFLSIEQEGGDDEQFLYLPALGRVRRITASQKDGSFVNSEFSYEDMQRRKVERDNHRLLDAETLLGKECWVIEATPKKENDSQYGKSRVWIAQDSFVPVKADLYSTKGTLVKQFLAHEIKRIDGIWTVTRSEMKNIEKGRSTALKIIEINYNNEISDNTFTTQYMQLRR